MDLRSSYRTVEFGGRLLQSLRIKLHQDPSGFLGCKWYRARRLRRGSRTPQKRTFIRIGDRAHPSIRRSRSHGLKSTDAVSRRSGEAALKTSRH
jgi:hypothetical protein